jgi:hypothetical protein
LSDWDDTWAIARAAADQRMAHMRDTQEEAMREFMRACIDFDASMRQAGIDVKGRTTTLTTIALGAALTEEG